MTTPWSVDRPPVRAPLHGRHDADVVVVGAGIVGLTSAVLLARAGRSVTVLEAREVASGTSGRTTAKVSALHGLRYRRLEDRHGQAVARQYADAQRAGLAWIAQQAAAAPQAHLERARAVTFATSRTGATELHAELSAAQRAGLTVAPLDDDDLPFATSAAIWLADQAQIDPAGYLHALAAELDASPNVALHEGSRVQRVHGRHHHEVTTDHGSVRAPVVVVATLLPVVDRGLHFARARPVSSYLVALRAGEPVPEGMFLGIDEPTRSLRTAPDTAPAAAGRLVLVGGEGHPTGRGGRTEARYAALVDWARRHLRAEEVVARWSAHDLAPVSGLPWVGPASPATPGVLVAGGFDKWGMTTGTAAALALTDRILRDGEHRSAGWSELFGPSPADLRSLASTVRLNAEVAGRMASGWARRALPGGPPAKTCTHLGGSCTWNDGDRTWDCPLHGSRFATDGTVLAAPAVDPLSLPTPSRSEGGS
jgi:glycine/D-amino acid oxidase-like deaminating enzyme